MLEKGQEKKEETHKLWK